MKKHLLVLLVVAALGGSILTVQAETYQLDPVHSSISFKIRHFFST